MKQTILFLIGAVIITIPTLNAQQPSPGNPTTKQQTLGKQPSPKPKTVRIRAPSQPAMDSTVTRNRGNEKTANNNRTNYTEALRRYHHERHDQVWWKRHYVVIVLVGGGYYYWDAGYWCPAWGYDRNYESYDYDGPIYTYDNLLPDQVVINVQHELKELGYYTGNVTGSLGSDTRHALRTYQADSGLDITGAVDEPTVRALGLI